VIVICLFHLRMRSYLNNRGHSDSALNVHCQLEWKFKREERKAMCRVMQ